MKNLEGIKIKDFLLGCESSTTKLFEEVSGKKLNVKVVYQREIVENDHSQLVRTSALSMGGSNKIVIYSIASFVRDLISAEQFDQLKEGCIPIGKIFGVDTISKDNIYVEIIKSARFAKKLNVQSNMVYSKKYDFLADGKRIGVVKEIFNEESLSGLWK